MTTAALQRYEPLLHVPGMRLNLDGEFVRHADVLAIAADLANVTEMFLDVLDSHYGDSTHHIGDGDSISEEMADRIRAWLLAQPAPAPSETSPNL